MAEGISDEGATNKKGGPVTDRLFRKHSYFFE
jgi:hypothetical protein